MRTIAVEVDIDTLEKAFLQSLNDTKHDMNQQLKYLRTAREKGTPYLGFFDSCIDQDEVEIEEFLRALESVRWYYGGY